MQHYLISKKAFLCLLDDDFAGFIKAREETVRQEFNKLCSENHAPTIDELLTDEDQHVFTKRRYDGISELIESIKI